VIRRNICSYKKKSKMCVGQQLVVKFVYKFNCPYGESLHLFVTFFSPFSVKGDTFLSQKGGEKFTLFLTKGDLLVDKMVTKISPKSVTKLSSPLCHTKY
jgi:hypothetical protein